MEAFNQIGPWITIGLLLGIVVFFLIFYVGKILKTKKASVLITDYTVARNNITLGVAQRKKLKDEIIHDIVADITPVLEKRLEKAF